MADRWRVLAVNLRLDEFNDVVVLALKRGVSTSDVVRHALGFAPEAQTHGRAEHTQQLQPLAGGER